MSTTPTPKSAKSASKKGVIRLAERRLARNKAIPASRTADVPYAQTQPALRGLTTGRQIKLIIETAAWKATVGAHLSKLDAKRIGNPHKPGTDPLYTSEELESVFLYRVLEGLVHVNEARGQLTSDAGAQCKAALGLDRPRNRKHTILLAETTDGVPSAATLSRHKKRFPDTERLALYQELFRLLNAQHLTEFPEAVEEARSANADGSKVEITGVAPAYDENGKLSNKKSVTHWDAGYVGASAPPDKRGNGYNFLAMFSSRSVPHTLPHFSRLNASERVEILRVLDSFEEVTLPHLPSDHITILSTDSAFNSPTVRRRAQERRIAMNTHFASHKKGDPATDKNVEARNRYRYKIDRYPNWRANGHREIACVCGNGSTSKKLEVGKKGELSIRTEGWCKNCRSISIVAGKWKVAQNPDRFAPLDAPGDPADWAFGNPFTFNDKVANELGNKRMGSENVHSMLSTRWRLLRGKQNWRCKEEAELETTIIFCAMHAIAMECRRREAAAPPGEHQLARAA